MLSFLVGAAVAVGMMKAARHGFGPFGRCANGRFGRGSFGPFGGWGSSQSRGCGHSRFGSSGPWGGASRSSRGPLRFLFYRLRTSPGQEGALADSVDSIRAAGKKLRDSAWEGRAELAKVMRESTLTPEKVRAAVAKQEAQLDTLRETLIAEVVKAHGVLDERQRNEAANLIEGRWHDEDQRDW